MDGERIPVRLRGLELRYTLTVLLLEAGRPLTVAELRRSLASQGLVVAGRASKTISDALRTEVSKGRVRRLDRNRYASGTMPRQTKSRIRQRVSRVRARARARDAAAQ